MADQPSQTADAVAGGERVGGMQDGTRRRRGAPCVWRRRWPREDDRRDDRAQRIKRPRAISSNALMTLKLAPDETISSKSASILVTALELSDRVLNQG
jgi:hypothetical protein